MALKLRVVGGFKGKLQLAGERRYEIGAKNRTKNNPKKKTNKMKLWVCKEKLKDLEGRRKTFSSLICT